MDDERAWRKNNLSKSLFEERIGEEDWKRRPEEEKLQEKEIGEGSKRFCKHSIVHVFVFFVFFILLSLADVIHTREMCSVQDKKDI